MAMFNSWLENSGTVNDGLPWVSVCLLLQPPEGVWEPPAKAARSVLLLGASTQL